MFINSSEFIKVKNKYFDPSNSITKLTFKDPSKSIRFHLGFIEDNKDPDKAMRVKVKFPQWGDNVITDWIPIIRPFSGKDMGMSYLPEIKEEVICCFINDNTSFPLVLGSLYNPNAKPKINDNDGNNYKIINMRCGARIELLDKKNEEKITISMKDDKIMMVLDKKNGITLSNDEGDIKIKCKKLTFEIEKEMELKLKKGLKIECQNDDFKVETKQGINFKSSQKTAIKGMKLKLKSASRMMIQAGKKTIAAKNDMVVGVDYHNIEVPTNTGTKTVPMIPHPYNGNLLNNLSNDVTVNDIQVAVKGSKSKFNTPGHICMPPGVKFTSQPNNEGEVASGTVQNVKVNDKEVAVMGTKVKTCNDPQPQETCSIIITG